MSIWFVNHAASIMHSGLDMTNMKGFKIGGGGTFTAVAFTELCGNIYPVWEDQDQHLQNH